MRKVRNLVILFIVFALLCGGLLYLNYSSNKKSSTAAQSDKKTDISKLDSKKISKMTLVTNSATTTLTKIGSTWKDDSYPSVNLLQDSVNNLLTSFASMQADRTIAENSSDVSQYGLDKPTVKASVTMDDGTTSEFYLGSKTPDGSDYYLMKKDGKTVYTVAGSIGDAFNYTINDLMDKKLTSIDSTKLTYFKYTPKNGKPIEIKADSSQAADGYSLTLPYSSSFGAAGDAFQKLLSGISALEIQGIVDANPTDLSKYGLNKDTSTLVAKDDKNTLSLVLGNDKDADNIYFKLSTSNTVYSLSKALLDPFNAKPFDLIDKQIELMNIDDVDKIQFEGPEGTKTMVLSRTTQKSGSDNNTVTTYKIDGKDIQEDNFKSWFEKLDELSFDAEADKKADEKAEYKITYYVNKGDKKPLVIEYCPYNSDFYQVYVNGKEEFLISKDKLKSLASDLQGLTK